MDGILEPTVEVRYSVHTRRKLFVAVAVVEMLGIGILVTIGLLCGKYLGGFAWDGSSKEFNVHPLCMAVGLIFFYGNAILVYRVFSKTEKRTVKILHVVLLGLALVCSIIGIVAVFQFHIANDIANMYSLHSWCGLTTVALYVLQFVAGFLSFLFPGIREQWKVLYLPFHRYFGGAILIFAGVSAVSGINEKLFFVFPKKLYQSLPPGAIVGNVCGFTIVAFIIAVLFVVQRSEWRASPTRISAVQIESARMVTDSPS